jgi:clan AA aspartic protease (TIGR02281 family)
MEGQSLRRWALKEICVWSAAFACCWLTFTSFEGVYDRAKAAAVLAGYAGAFDFDMRPASLLKFETRVSNSSPPLHGTYPGSKGLPASPTHKEIVLSANAYGHFHAAAEINGQEVDFMTDTGATYVALAYETAQKLGLAPQNMRFTGRSTTANGVARVASTQIDAIRIGEITVRNVQAVVAEPGRMAQNLLGMSFISQLTGFELNGTTLTMRE